MNNRLLSTCRYLLVLVLLCLTQFAWAQDVTVSLDRSQVNEGESFQVTFTVEGDANAIAPDFSPLEKNFIMMGKSRSSQITIVNSQTKTVTQWTLSLAAKTTGKLTIPAMEFGRFKSNPLPIQVSPAGTKSTGGKARSVFLNITVDKTSPYVQSQVLYTVKLFYAVSIGNGNLSDPQSNDAIIMRLGSDQRYQARRNGRIYQVLERNYAIFPQHSGKLEITAPIFSGVANLNRSNFSGMNPLLQSGEPIRISSKTETLTVKPIPADVKSNNWLPAKNITIQETWSGNLNKIQVGKPVTRTIIIKADGLAAAQIPNPSFKDSKDYNVYPDKPQLSNTLHDRQVQGQLIQKIAYIPTESGEIHLPPIRISWWNTSTKKSSVSALPARKLMIAASTSTAAQSATAPTTTTQTATVAAPTAAAIGNKASVTVVNSKDDGWFIAAIILTAAWLITLFLWLKSRAALNKKVPTEEEVFAEQYFQSVKLVRIALKNACVKNQTEKARDLLLKWANRVWTDKQFRNLGALAKQVGDSPLAKQIQLLNEVLYASTTKSWKGKKLFAAFDDFNPQQNNKKFNDVGGLPPLYPEKI